MEEKVFVGYGYGRFKNDRGDMQDYCNVFMLEDFTGSENSDYHFGGQKAVKYRCLKPELFADLTPGEVVRRFFDGKGRISYITSPARQENLYATYNTADAAFWTSLARENQQEFKRSGTKGTCIEAREFIIALPEKFTRYDPQRVLAKFTEEFQKRYNVECVSGLHHNKAKTNYHIHLIFSERRLLLEPVVKIATRSMFYDEAGRHVRTKKEITGKDGRIRPGCTAIKKGEVYESHMFSVKDTRFKQEGFVAEVKEFYTGLINRYISDPEQQLKVFDPQSVYLPTKKIGKNNPRAEEIKADNAARQEWNRTADMALLTGISEAEILEVKQAEIHEKVRQSI